MNTQAVVHTTLTQVEKLDWERAEKLDGKFLRLQLENVARTVTSTDYRGTRSANGLVYWAASSCEPYLRPCYECGSQAGMG